MYYTIVNISEDKENPMHIVCYKDLPLYYPNRFLNEKGKNSGQTRGAYAKVLVRFFNYFEDVYGITDYREIKQDGALQTFMHSIIYDYVEDTSGRRKYLYDADTLITPATANSYMNRIQIFYLKLEKPLKELINYDSDYLEKLLTLSQKKSIQQVTSYKGIWNVLDLSELDLKPNTKWKDKSKKKTSFTKEEVILLAKNLNKINPRDECIFLTCLETGARITEVLTGLKKLFKKNSQGTWTFYISKSKTAPRYVAIQPYLAKKINKYINTERRRITKNLSQYEYVFVSTKGETKGERLSYHSFRTNLKKAGKLAGMDTKLIMTHMSRATKATQMYIEGKSKEEIKKALGNKTVINPYIDYGNPELIKLTGKALYYNDEEQLTMLV